MANPPRIGKTRKDRSNGAHQQNLSNKAAREVWNKPSGKNPFPDYTCGGKGNSSNPIKIVNGQRQKAR